MELYKDILAAQINSGRIPVEITVSPEVVQQIVSQKCYQALEQIKAILSDPELSDAACVRKLEDVLAVFEALHDLETEK